MKLKRLTLENVRSHKNNTIEFKKGITVIAGRTGSGKSSIFMAIDYALFGSENVSSSEIMRRDSKQMIIALEFEHNKNNYTIIRGLKRNKNNISIDFDNLRILENKKQLNSLSRVKDINAIVRNILSYPENIKSSQMFQVTSYTKQDEIRKLIEMKKEERQAFIDRVLLLSKYKTTYENLKDVRGHFTNKINELSRIDGFKDSLSKEIETLKKQRDEYEKEIHEKSGDLSTSENKLEKIKSKREELNKLVEDLNQKIIKQKETNALLKNVKEQINKINESQKLHKDKMNELNKSLLELKNIKDRNETEGEIKVQESRISVYNSKLKSLEKDEKIITKKGSLCPFCKQNITDLHAEKLKKVVDEKRKTYGFEKNSAVACLDNLYMVLKQINNKEELEKEIKQFEILIHEGNKLLISLNEKNKIGTIVKTEELENKLKKLKINLNVILNEEKALFSNINSSNEIKQRIKKEIIMINNNINTKMEQLNKYENELGKKKKTVYMYKLLGLIRDYVKEIRAVIRQRFLLDFRASFQKTFEDIRKQEEEYSVELENDYEPIAYTARGDAVPINQLSGGEKTSVALAYRLALSDLASQMNNVVPSNLLLLDEPTTGFDEEDIKSLPDALRSITNIPQIIIVTHENLLKEIADYNISITKIGNSSVIQ